MNEYPRNVNKEFNAACTRVKASGADEGYEPVVNRFAHVCGDILGAKAWIETFPDLSPLPRIVPKRDSKPTRNTTNVRLSRSVPFDMGRCEGVRKYEALAQGQHHFGLFGLLNSIAMSAYNAGYDLSAGELAEFVWDKQYQVLGKHPPTSYSWSRVQQKAERAIADAPNRVPDPYYQRRWGAKLKGYASKEEMWAELFGRAGRKNQNGGNDE